MTTRKHLPIAATLALLATSPTLAQDFNVGGATRGRDGRAATAGPITPNLEWTADFPMQGRSQPVAHDGGLLVLSNLAAQTDLIVLDLETGTFRWNGLSQLTQPGEFLSIVGASAGRVFAWARLSGSQARILAAFDFSDGSLVWSRSDLVPAFYQLGAAFSEDGDLFLGERLGVMRIDGATGATEWNSPWSVTQEGTTYAEGRLFAPVRIDAGDALIEFDPATGAVLAQTDQFGFDDVSPAFVSPTGGSLFIVRADDFGRGLDLERAPFGINWQDNNARMQVQSQPAFAADGTLYMFNRPGVRLRQRRMDNGALIGLGPPVNTAFGAYGITVDTVGTVYASYPEQSLPSGTRLMALTPDLQQVHFTMDLVGRDLQAPVVAGDGLLIIQDRDQLRAYRNPAISTSFCGPATPNSSGQSATLVVRGSLDLADGQVVARASGLPVDVSGYFLASTTPGFAPGAGGSSGTLCLGGSVGRFNQDVLFSGDSGYMELVIDPQAIPQPGGVISALTGETWQFQLWFRDSDGSGGATSNFTDGAMLTFR